MKTTVVTLFSLFVSPLVASGSSSPKFLRHVAASECNKAKNKDACFDSKDEDGGDCVWCACKAIPSECLSQDQSKLVPPGVFQCTTPSFLDKMILEERVMDNDFCDANSKSGYVSLDQSAYNQDGEDKHLFYWMFEKRSDANATRILDGSPVPFIVWLTGGPGCSSSMALLTENGPCSVNKDGKTTALNPYSWTEAGHVLWLDQPAGVGFSYGKETDYNEEMVSEDAYWFLQKFFESHPEYLNSPLFITGESYGGHYVPAIAHRIWKYNQDLPNGAQTLNLKGIAVGNGLTKPEEQYKWYPEMAYNNSHGIKTVPEEVYEGMKAVVPKCQTLIHQCNKGDNAIDTFACQSAFLVCNMGLTSPYQATGLNPYDIRQECKVPPLCYDFSHVTKFMNSESTRQALGVTNKSHKWASCNFGINMKFHTDWMKDFSHYVADMANDDLAVLIYAGDVDYICNYLGNEAWSYQLQWKGGDAFRATEPHDWNDGAGLVRTIDNFTFLQVYDAGHMVPSDQPKAALEMIQSFVSGEGF